MSIKEAVKRDGPFSLDPQAGVRLFGNFKKHASGGQKAGKSLRALSLGLPRNENKPSGPRICDIWTEHVAHGVWRCKRPSCKPCDACDGLSDAQRKSGFRNAPDAPKCRYCGAEQPKSQADPLKQPDPHHEGLYIVTANNFDAEVINFDGHFSCSSLPTGAPFEGDEARLVPALKLLQMSKQIRVGLLDSTPTSRRRSTSPRGTSRT